MNDLKVGDVVQLKSGGLKMTVSDVDSLKGDPKGSFVRCVWSEEQGGEKVFRNEVLPAACLMMAP